MMSHRPQIQTRNSLRCAGNCPKRILEVPNPVYALWISQDSRFSSLWGAPLSSRILKFFKFYLICGFSVTLNRSIKKNFEKTSIFEILSFCEIYVFSPQYDFPMRTISKSTKSEKGKISKRIIDECHEYFLRKQAHNLQNDFYVDELYARKWNLSHPISWSRNWVVFYRK